MRFSHKESTNIPNRYSILDCGKPKWKRQPYAYRGFVLFDAVKMYFVVITVSDLTTTPACLASLFRFFHQKILTFGKNKNLILSDSSRKCAIFVHTFFYFSRQRSTLWKIITTLNWDINGRVPSNFQILVFLSILGLVLKQNIYASPYFLLQEIGFYVKFKRPPK